MPKHVDRLGASFAQDRGIPSEAVLAEMRQSDPPVRYLVSTPKGRLTPWGEQFHLDALARLLPRLAEKQLYVTLQRRLYAVARGLTAGSALESSPPSR